MSIFRASNASIDNTTSDHSTSDGLTCDNPTGDPPASDNPANDNSSIPLRHAPWSVPAQRVPYPAITSYPDAEEPTERIAVPAEPAAGTVPDEARHRRNWPAVLAVVIAVTALAVAGGATVTAWQAFARADEAASMTHSPAAVPAVIPSVPVTAATSAPAAVLPLLPAGYAMRYAQEPLRIPPGCGTVSLVDLDAPRVGSPDQQGDLRYDNACGASGPQLAVGPGAQVGSLVADPDTDAPGCAEAVRAKPLAPDAGVPVRKGTALCVLTSVSGTPMVGLVEVTGVDSGGGASLRASAWSAVTDPSALPSDGAPPGPSDGASPAAGDAVPSDEATPGE